MRPINDVLADIAQARSINDADALLLLASELDEHQTPLAEAHALKSRGTASLLRGAYDTAEELLSQALSLFLEISDQLEVARTQAQLGGLSVSRGDIAIARERLHHAHMQCQENGDRRLETYIISALGQVALNTGDIAVALEHFYTALSICEELDDQHGVAGATCNIGLALSLIDEYASALEHFHRALQISVDVGNKRWAANALLNIGNVFSNTKDHAAALEYYGRAMVINTEIGNTSGLAVVTTAIGWTHQSMGDLDTALSYHYQAMEQHSEIGETHAAANDLCNIILVLLEKGLHDEARHHLTTLDAQQIDDPTLRIWRDQCRAEICVADGDLEGAARILHWALQEATTYSLRAKTADVHKALRDLAQRQNDLGAYIEHNNAYVHISEEINGKDTTAKLATQAAERRIAIERQEHQKQLAILHATLPRHIADRVSRGEQVNDHYDNAAVIFIDVVDFTAISDELTSEQVVDLLHTLFSALDATCKQHDVVKIKTIGDSYMAVAFPHDGASSTILTKNVEQRAARCAVEMLDAVRDVRLSVALPGRSALRVRIGVHSGPVTAGVIGTERLQYDVWGDTVNVASRMESSGQAGRVHITEAIVNAIENTEYRIEERGEIEVKGKGKMHTYWLEACS